jgi:hypothetical protein
MARARDEIREQRIASARIAFPLAQLRPLSNDQETQEAVGDWLY